MGLQPHLTTLQAAFTFARQTCLDRLNEQAKNLYADGYRVEPSGVDGELYVHTGQPYALPYVTDYSMRACSCEFHNRQANGESLDPDGLLPCKHLVGLPGLVIAQLEELLLDAETAHHDEEHALERALWEQIHSLLAAWTVTQWLREGEEREAADTDWPEETGLVIA